MRLRDVLETNKLNPTAISRQYGAVQKTLHNQIYGDTALTVSTILLISEILPDLSMDWLLKGRGERMQNSGQVVANSVNSNINSDNSTVAVLSEDFVRDILAEKDKQIQTLLTILRK